MADKFRYSIDLGSGYVLLTSVSDNNVKLKFSKDVSLMVKYGSISGSLKLIGSEAVNAWTYRTTSYYVPFKIEEYNGSGWNDLYECSADLRGQYLSNSKVLTINNFKENNSQLTNVLAGIKKPFKTNNLGISQTTISQTITPSEYKHYSGNTALIPPAWEAAFDLEGIATTARDPRWDLYTWQATTGISPFLVHQWSTRRFDFRSGTQTNLNGYTETNIGIGTFLAQVPPFPYTGAGFSAQLTDETYRLDHVLDAVISAFDATLSFDSADAGDFSGTEYYYIGDGNDFDNSEIEGIDFTLDKIFKFMDKYLNYSWYLDSNKLKFKGNAWKFSNSLLNWSSEMANNDQFIYSYNPMPDRELWNTGDQNLDRFLISYFDKDVNTDNNELDYSTDIMQDFWEILKGGLSKSKLIWIRTNGGTGVVMVRTMQDFFNDGYISASFCNYARFIVPTDPATAYSTVPTSASDTRPVVSVKHNKWIDDYSAFDLFVRINTGDGLGYLNNYEINLDSAIGTFDMWKI